MINTDKTKEIRATIKKELGYTNRQVSVSSKNSSIVLKVKDIGVNIHKVKEIAEKHENIHYCEATGEILSGGNTYVSVNFDYDVLEEESKKYLERATEILSSKNGHNIMQNEDTALCVVFDNNISWNTKAVIFEHGNNCSSYRYGEHLANTPERLAQAMTIYAFQGSFKI